MNRLFFTFPVIILIVFSVQQVAVGQQLSEELTVVPMKSIGLIDVTFSKEQEIALLHNVRDGNVFVECFVNDFSYSEERAGKLHVEGEGHLRLYVNDELLATLYEGAFLIEGLPKGKHTIQIKLIKNDRTPYEAEETIEVTI